ncbi:MULTISPECIES: MFS transporter [Rhodococcus]|uniref:MFS transporter n=1 Tax=Rhodococcus oxybenzonivorans TaxID=1990687 RepID=A0AAE4V4D8_9NOCA|nr:MULTISPECIES: MFS transporter [Rhodococcus]MDV7243431.1 MFS transporter [Rhodococcus oxybenzonivorans]MDV7268650.1 MFS transporter [Rhodococcus oxybenzonivorans]MDV7276857.1 MFS transporter [Rhodococcus oxybenzonivorans]MDV7334309.1 MFS transporter [Rhodococcus oxybenzonivorans]MDV7344464.1 MFS transporter [Rhodococcus oxybenzonivorans]
MTSDIAPPAPQARIAPPRLHYAWLVAMVAFLALVGAASFRAAPSILIDPLHEDFGWSRASISSAVSINLVLYGLTSPFAAALMERFGMRRVVTAALVLVSAGSGLTIFMTATWQLVLLWGVFVGLGTGSMALAFVATVVDRWFVARRGLVTGILTAGSAAGQLVFLPILAVLAERYNWQTVALTVSFAALAVVPLVLMFLRNRPSDVGTVPYGAGPDYLAEPPAPTGRGGAAGRAVTVLLSAARTRVFWLLAGTFAICGASTNGLVGTHFVPAAHDHGMPTTAAASLLAVIGIFDVVGTIASGWFTDRFDSRKLLGIYYLLRGISLMLLPILFAGTVHPPMIAFVIFYGLDWVATVPPTVSLCRKHFGADAPIVFGWVLASHQIGAGIVAFLAGFVRDEFGRYDAAFYVAGGLCAIAAVMSLAIVAKTPRAIA